MGINSTDLIDEAALAARAGKDAEAFTRLYRRYLGPLYGYLFNRCGDRTEAEDLASQVWTEALAGLVGGRYQPRGSFAAWLFTIARRRAVDHFRARPSFPLFEMADPAPSPGQVAEHHEQLSRLGELLEGLDEPSRELLRLRYAGGLSFAEVGQVMGRSEAAVKMAHYRLLDRIRINWEQQDDNQTEEYAPAA